MLPRFRVKRTRPPFAAASKISAHPGLRRILGERQRAAEIRRVPRRETIALTGWALHGTRDADHGLPLSDHADFRELVEFAEQCRAGVIYVTHGSRRFAEELRRRGIRAEFLRGKPQMRLF